MMMHSSGAASLSALVLLAAGSVPAVRGHGYLVSPRSRNKYAYDVGRDWISPTDPDAPLLPAKEYCPHCLNRGGLCGTSSTTGPSGALLNYDDPENAIGGSLGFTLQETFTEGGEITFETVLTAHHRGHFEFRLCPLGDGQVVPTQACFDQHKLEFVSDELYGGTKHNAYPERAYIAPSSFPGIQQGGSPPGVVFKHKFLLPVGLHGDRIALQWHYITGNSCQDEGYSSYTFPGAWGESADLSTCSKPLPADGAGVPEQFWNCADIKILPSGPTAPTPPPVPTPTIAAPTPTLPSPTQPTTPIFANMCGTSWEHASSHCGTPCPTGNATVCPSMEKCYAGVNVNGCGAQPTPTMPPPTPTAPPPSPTPATGNSNYCGVDWNDANGRCGTACPGGQNSECPSGEFCFADCTCTGPAPPPSPTPATGNSNYCGVDWNDANSKCGTACPGGQNSECPSGEFCFADCTACAGPVVPTEPTTSAPVPAPVPTAPTPTVIANEDSRMIAFLGNWESCPTTAQMAQYTHILISFAVSYTWSPSKNICDQSCTIGSPVPICGNQNRQDLVDQWRADGKKVILSFGGAGMGGSWSTDVNDCWEYCFGKEGSVISQLKTIVQTQRFDGVDIDYEYFYEDNGGYSTSNGNGAAARKFIEDVTVGLKQQLPTGQNIVTHAPMEPDMVAGSSYYDILKNNAASVDFIMPQYYNGHIRTRDNGLTGGSPNALSHYNNLVNNMFGGDATRVVFGFCISDCPGFNVLAQEAKNLMTDLSTHHSCNGGAFFWAVHHDTSASWSSVVNQAIQPSAGCSATPTGPTTSPVTGPAVTPAPATPAPVTPAPVNPVTSAPVSSGPITYEAGTTARCGSSELDARGNCRNTCESQADCAVGQWCWGVHPNYCDDTNFDAPNYVNPVQSSVYYRCGKTEVEARELCKSPCTHAGQCAAGESCIAVNINYCGSAVADERRSLRG